LAFKKLGLNSPMKGRARTHRQLDIENFFQPKNALVTPPLQKMETIASSSETKVETTALALKQKGLRRHIHTRRKVQKPIFLKKEVARGGERT
jgi:hypothetical protein